MQILSHGEWHRLTPILVAMALSGGLAGPLLAADDSYKAIRDERWECPPRQAEELPPLQIPRQIFYAPPGNLEVKPFLLPAPPPGRGVPGAKATAAEVATEGYRVQLYAGADQASARGVQTKVQEQSEYAVYLSYEAPQYKVRMGDFVQREEAIRVCQQYKTSGFPDAWVVRSAINPAH